MQVGWHEQWPFPGGRPSWRPRLRGPGKAFTRSLGTERGGRAARGTAWLRVTRDSPGTTAQEETLSPSSLIPRPMAGLASCLLNVEPVCKCRQFGSPAGNRLLTISLHFHPSQSQGGGRPVLSSLGTQRAGRAASWGGPDVVSGSLDAAGLLPPPSSHGVLPPLGPIGEAASEAKATASHQDVSGLGADRRPPRAVSLVSKMTVTIPACARLGL